MYLSCIANTGLIHKEFHYLDLNLWVFLIKMCNRGLQMCFDQPITRILGNLLFIQDRVEKIHNNATKDVAWQSSAWNTENGVIRGAEDAGCLHNSKNNHHATIKTTIKCDNEHVIINLWVSQVRGSKFWTGKRFI